jgi:hypothetical protein
MRAMTIRWLMALLATGAVFTGSAWLCGSFLMRSIAPADVRWLLAVGLGSALAALAALWGKWWATRDDAYTQTSASGSGKRAKTRGDRSIAAGGDIGIASTGDNAVNLDVP